MLRDEPISTTWSSGLAYVVGLITSDGCLYNDGRHISLCSKDEEILQHVKDVLKIRNKIGRKARGSEQEKKYFVLQFGSVDFYKFLLSIGLTPAKSLTLGELKIPDEYFGPFLRGCIDGDGSIGIFTHPESIRPQLRVSLCSASSPFLLWIKQQTQDSFRTVGGWISTSQKNRCSILRYGIADSIIILNAIYSDKGTLYLGRKFTTAEEYLDGWRNWYTRTV